MAFALSSSSVAKFPRLCGTFTLDGYEFVTGCNDFGGGLVRHLEELGVARSSARPRRDSISANTALKCRQPCQPWQRWPAPARAFLGIPNRTQGPGQTLGQLIDGAVQDRLLMAAAAIPAYALLRSPMT
ncbi:dehydrogenase domain protein [Mycobacterium ulcerans str. Harvey]|uniref:Dehydrogenase domain protein n=1 Tax=Mycobacterium ulcerans str. Harvey TaxID=1299332 RepID=A0ABN0R9N3_MYCUL|nr:dehydrogenase domain protein [Mycobacterium ulcerans str. Harvey]